MTLRTCLLTIAVALLGPTLAQATLVTYTSLPAFQAAAGATTTTTFEGLAPSGGATYYGLTGLTIGGVTINASDSQLYALSANYNCQGVAGACSLGTGDFMEGSIFSQNAGGTTTFAPGAGVYAFALNYRAYDQQPGLSTNSNGTFDVSVNGGTPFSITSTSISNFIGIVSTTPLTSIAFTPTGGIPNQNLYAEFFHFDNMVTGAGASATPEPGTSVLLSAGLLAQGFLVRRG